MRDRIGNAINQGDLVRWEIPEHLVKRIVFEVLHVSDGGIATPQGITPPVIRIAIMLPVAVKDASEPVLEDFLCVRNPQSEGLLDALSNSKGGRTQ